MSKPIHPIVKMQRAIWKSNRTWDVDPAKEAETIARHVKPLLDALEQAHNGHHVDALYCSDCRLLTTWRAKP